MFTQRQTFNGKAVLSVLTALLLQAASGQSTESTTTMTTPTSNFTTSNSTTSNSTTSNSSLTTQLIDSTVVEPLLLKSHRPCGSEDVDYCKNGGVCMYPQDSDKASCICPSSFTGQRCMFDINVHHVSTKGTLAVEELIAVMFGAALLLFILALLVYCIVYRRCKKAASAPLIKSAPSEMSV